MPCPNIPTIDDAQNVPLNVSYGCSGFSSSDSLPRFFSQSLVASFEQTPPNEQSLHISVSVMDALHLASFALFFSSASSVFSFKDLVGGVKPSRLFIAKQITRLFRPIKMFLNRLSDYLGLGSRSFIS